MVRRVLEQFFRHKLLIVIPALVIPLVAVFVSLQTPPVYTASANIWVERAPYVTYQNDLDRFSPPADIQAKRLRELLRTRTFVSEVASRSPLPRAAGTSNEAALGESIVSMEVGTGGAHLLILRANSSEPTVAFAAVSGLIDAYKDRARQDTIENTGLAQAFYQERLKEAEDRVTKSTDELRQYLAEHPVATTRPGTPPTPGDISLAQLQRRVDLDGADVERIRATLEQSRRDGVAAQAGQEIGFQVVDEPLMPRTARRELRKMLVLPAVGAVAGLGVSGALLMLFVAADRSVRHGLDLGAGVRVLGVIPAYTGKRVGPDGVRQAIGFVAGARRRSRDARIKPGLATGG